jgi:hypothetical protein
LELFNNITNFTGIAIESVNQTTHVSDELFIQIYKNNINTLQSLNIAGTAITNGSLATLLTLCPTLTELHLYSWNHIINGNIESLIAFLGNLLVLSITSTSVKLPTLKSLVLFCSKLTKLSVYFCSLFDLESAELVKFCIVNRPELKLDVRNR